MRGMILAAGQGLRMGEITKETPKPLLKVNGRYLIEYSIELLKKASITDIVINVSYLKNRIMQALGNGERFGVRIFYSEETEPLETGGGIIKALPLLGNEPFIILSADVITNYPLDRLMLMPSKLAHLVLIKNPPYNMAGDFSLNDKNEIYIGPNNPWTFANIGIYHPELFANRAPSYQRLGNLWRDALSEGKLTGESYSGLWYNVGTPQELQTAEEALV